MDFNPKVRVLPVGTSIQLFTIWCVGRVLKQTSIKVVVHKDDLEQTECTSCSATLNQDLIAVFCAVCEGSISALEGELSIEFSLSSTHVASCCRPQNLKTGVSASSFGNTPSLFTRHTRARNGSLKPPTNGRGASVLAASRQFLISCF
jgi:hypothetical protein